MKNIITESNRDFIWNALGSLIYAMASIVLAFAVIRIAGPSEGGIFGFGFSTLGQQMFIISYFGIRPFHITDMKRQFSFSDYLLTRRITSVLAFLGSLLFVGIQMVEGNYDLHKSLILVLLSLYKIIDGYADVYESELQRQDKLYRTGQSLAFRTSLSVLTLLLVLLVSGNLFVAVAAADVMQIMGTRLFAVRVLGRGLAPTAHEFKKSYELISSTALLFLSVFVDFYIFSASKYAIDAELSDAASGYFNVLFMPTSFIYLIANFLIRPMLTKLATYYSEKNKKAFDRTCMYMVKAVAALSALILVLTFIFGRFGLGIFEFILGPSADGKLRSEFMTFVLLIAGGSLYAFANVMYYILVTVRKQLQIFIGYVLTATVAVLTAGPMVLSRGMLGGAMNYVMLMSMLTVIFSAYTFVSTRDISK